MRDNWKKFAEIVLEPWTLVFLLATLGLLIGTFFTNDPKTLGFLTVVITITSTVVGGLISKHHHEKTEGRVLKAKGESSIRGLKLLLSNVASLDSRIEQIRERILAKPEKELMITTLEEISGRCNVIEEEALSSIENWTDIIPEANVKTQIGVISDLTRQINDLGQNRTALQEQLDKVTGASSADRDKIKLLEQDIAGQAAKVEKLTAELRQKEIKLNQSVLAGITPPGGLLYNNVVASNHQARVQALLAQRQMMRRNALRVVNPASTPAPSPSSSVPPIAVTNPQQSPPSINPTGSGN
jgi:hypothetical protein